MNGFLPHLILLRLLSANVAEQASGRVPGADISPTQLITLLLGTSGLVGLVGLLIKLWISISNKRRRDAEANKFIAEANLFDMKAIKLEEESYVTRLLHTTSQNETLKCMLPVSDSRIIFANILSNLGHIVQHTHSGIAFDLTVDHTVIPVLLKPVGIEHFEIILVLARINTNRMKKQLAIRLLLMQEDLNSLQIYLKRGRASYLIGIRARGCTSSSCTRPIETILTEAKHVASALLKVIADCNVEYGSCDHTAQVYD